MPPQFRLGDGDPPEWQPPDYAQPVDEGEWTPPDYAKPVEEPKKTSKLLNTLKPAERIHPSRPKIFDNISDVAHRFASGVSALPESIAHSVNEIGRTGAEQIRSGDISGAFRTAVSPLMGPIDAVNQTLARKATGQDIELPSESAAKHESLSQILGVVGLPSQEVIDAYKEGNYAKLAGMGLTAAAIAGLGHYAGKKIANIEPKQPKVFRQAQYGIRETSEGYHVIDENSGERLATFDTGKEAQAHVDKLRNRTPTPLSPQYAIRASEDGFDVYDENTNQLLHKAKTAESAQSFIDNIKSPGSKAEVPPLHALGQPSQEDKKALPIRRESLFRPGGSVQGEPLPSNQPPKDLGRDIDIQAKERQRVEEDPYAFAGESIRQPEATQRDFGYNARDSFGPGYVSPVQPGDLDPRQLRGEVSPVPSPNIPPQGTPPPQEPPIQQPRAFVNPFEKKDLTKTPDIFNHVPDVSGQTLMTGERVRDLFNMEPKEAESKGLVKYDDSNVSQGVTGYRVVQPEQTSDTRPLPIRSPNLDVTRFPLEPTAGRPTHPEGNVDTSRYTPEDIAKGKVESDRLLNKFGTKGKETSVQQSERRLSPDVAPPAVESQDLAGKPSGWKPPEYAKPAPTQSGSVGEELRSRHSSEWQERVDELDAKNAPDSAYRDILSTGARYTLKKGETWRKKILQYIDMAKKQEADIEPSFEKYEPGLPSDKNKVSIPDIDKQMDELDKMFNADPLEPNSGRSIRNLLNDYNELNRQSSTFTPTQRQKMILLSKRLALEMDRLSKMSMSDRIKELNKQDIEPSFARAWNPSIGASNPQKYGTIENVLKNASADDLFKYREKLQKDLETSKKVSLTGYGGYDGAARRRIIFNEKRLKMIEDEIENRITAIGGKGEEEKPSFAKVKGGGLVIDTNIKRATQNLTKDYTGALSGIMSREGMQNALDAADKLGENGLVKIRITPEKGDVPGSIEIHDNGSGLDETGLSEKLVRLFASGKSEEEGATGGKGIGSASYIAGGKHFEIKTIAVDSIDGKKYEITAGGTPDQFQDPEKGSDWNKVEVPEDTPTGTSIKVTLKPEQDTYESRVMTDKILAHTRERSSKIIYDKYGNTGGNISEMKPSYSVKTHEFKSSKGDKLIGKFTLDNNDVRIQVPPSDLNVKRSETNIHFLNNGMYQFSDYISTRTEAMKGIPEDVIVNIHPLVDEMHDDYPFINTREDLKKDLRVKIKDYIEKNITKPAIDERKNRTQEIYDSLSAVPVKGTERKPLFFDPGNRLTPDELAHFKNSITSKRMIYAYDSIIDDILGRVGRDNWSERLEGVGLSLDPGSHGMHIPNPTTGKSSITLNPFIRMSYSTPADAAFDNVITMLHEVGHIGKEAKEDFDWSEADTKDPRFIKYLTAYQKQILQHGDIGFQSTGHQMDFVHRLGEVFAKFGVEPTFDAADRLEELYTNGSKTGEYSPEIQKLLQIYEESRGREATTEDLLSPTGIKQKRGKSDSGGGDSSDGEGTLRSAVDKLFKGLSQASDLESEQRSIYKAERAERFSRFSSVKQGGAAGAARSLSKLRGEYEKVNPGEDLGLNKKETDVLFTTIKRSNITPGEQARGYTALFKLLDGTAVPQRNELAILDNVFGGGFADKITELHGGIGMVGLKLSKAANTMKSMQNAISLAAPLRHGAGLLYRKEFYPAFRDMFKFFANKEFFDNSKAAMEEHPNYIKSREAGLFLSRPDSVLNSEEEFLNSYVGQIPRFTGIPQTVGASQRAYTGFLNKLRFDTFNEMIKTAESLGTKMFEADDHVNMEDTEKIKRLRKFAKDNGISSENKSPDFINLAKKNGLTNTSYTPTKEARAIAKYINNATGRGDLGSLNKMTNELNVLLWSPRMISSRINMLANPKIYMDLPKGMRTEGLKSLLGIASMGLIINGLGALGGAKLGTNILSSDFMKSRFSGNKVMDPNAGIQQFIVAAARFLAGKTDSKIPTTRLDIAGKFLAGKESPAASLAHSLLTAKKFEKPDVNDPFNLGNYTTQYGEKANVNTQILKQFTPIFIQDLNSLVQSEPDWSKDIGLDVAMGAASLAGMSQNYPEKKVGFTKLK